MPRSWPGHLLAPSPQARAHHLFPLGPFGVAYQDRNRRSQCLTVPDPTQNLEMVVLDGHPLATAMTVTTAGQLASNAVDIDIEAPRQPFHDRDEARSM